MKLEKFEILLDESQKKSIKSLGSFLKFFIIAEIIIFLLFMCPGDFLYNSETKMLSFLGMMLLITALGLVVVLLLMFPASLATNLDDNFILDNIPLISGEDLISHLQNKEIYCQYSKYRLSSDVGQVFLLKNNDLVRYKGVVDIIDSEKYIDYAFYIQRNDGKIV